MAGELSEIETIATGRALRNLQRLRRLYGKGRWRKMKGVASIRLGNGQFDWQNYTGMRRMASARRNSSASGASTKARRTGAGRRRFVVCVRSDGYEASLERDRLRRPS